MLERGVDLDLQYVADDLWNVRSEKKSRSASWNRFRGTVNLDLGKLTGAHELYFHITGLWQAGGNIGTYLGTIANPSGIASVNTFRLDSYWIEKRFLNERLVARIGQFAGQDFYGTQHEGVSFVTEPLDYAFTLFRKYFVALHEDRLSDPAWLATCEQRQPEMRSVRLDFSSKRAQGSLLAMTEMALTRLPGPGLGRLAILNGSFFDLFA